MLGRAARLALCLLLSLSSTGCTVIGYGVGNAVDRARAREAPPTLEALHDARGRDVVLHLRDGSELRRRLVRIDSARDTLLVLEPYRSNPTRFAGDSTPDSIRVARTEVASLSVQSNFGRRTLAGLGFFLDVTSVVVLANSAGALTVPD